jgi:glycosyltransferase involved in cell wall biosynthesis
MNLLLVDSVDIPFGGAHSMHVALLMKGLKKNSINAFLIIPYGRKREKLTTNQKNTGHYDGVPFCIIRKSRNANKFITFLERCLGTLNATYLIYKRNRRKKVDGVILGGMPDLLRDSPIILLCMICNIPLYSWFVEKMSLSKDYNGIPGFLNKQSQKITEIILPKLSSGVIVISTLLKNHYLKYLPEYKILINPILVSEETQNNYTAYSCKLTQNKIADVYYNKKLLVYSGSFAEKDGIFHLIDAFREVNRRYPDMIFIMTGNNPDKKIMDRVTAYIENLHLEGKIKLLGFVSSEELHYYNHIAEILFVCRTSSSFANYGFPWKLGEYCMTGKPIIATKVGDIECYFTNNENLFIVEPDNSLAIAEKILFVFENYKAALTTAEKGKETALKCFNYMEKTRELAEFIQNNNKIKQISRPVHN